MLRCDVSLPARATGLVVRPRGSGSVVDVSPGFEPTEETLVFFPDRIHQLEGGFRGKAFKLGRQLRLTDSGGAPHSICDSTPCAIYDPFCDCVLFVEGYAVMALGGDNAVTLLAGNQRECDRQDGVGAAARFQYIRAMATDGRGSIYVAESQEIRKITLTLPPPLSPQPSSPQDASSGGGCGLSGDGSGISSASGAASPADASPSSSSNGSSRSSTGSGSSNSSPNNSGPSSSAACQAQPAQQLTASVTTLRGSNPPRDRWFALAYEPHEDALLAATDTAVFRIGISRGASPFGHTHHFHAGSNTNTSNSVRSNPDAAAFPDYVRDIGRGNTSSDGDGGDDDGVPRLLAGDSNLRGRHDGFGGTARLYSLTCMLALADGGGVILCDSASIRKLDVASGEVGTLFSEGSVPEDSVAVAVLPSGGSLAVCGSNCPPHNVVLVGLGFQAAMSVAGVASVPPPLLLPPQLHWLRYGAGASPCGDRYRSYRSSGCGAAAAAAAAGGGGACSSSGGAGGCPPLLPGMLTLGLLQQPQGGGEAVITVAVEGVKLVAHRAVLAAHSEYFKQLLTGSFAEAAASKPTQVELLDALPEAFTTLLAYMYTGWLDVPKELLRPAAELAGRLLMPAACTELQRRLLAGVTPGSVVSELLWADRHNLTELVWALKAYWVRNRRQVAAAVGGDTAAEGGGGEEVVVRQLAEANPGLVAELLVAVSAAR